MTHADPDTAAAAEFAAVRGPGLSVGALERELGGRVRVEGNREIPLWGVHHDSRRIQSGDVFVARRGAQANGVAHVSEAMGRGAVAVFCAAADVPRVRAGADGRPLIVVKDDGSARFGAAFAHAASAVYGHPSFSVEAVGVTGTNGKTTVTFLVQHALDSLAGRPACARIGTVGHKFGAYGLAASHTTPEADELARLFLWFRGKGAEYAAMEVSSIALDARRADGVRFRVAAFTNLTQDHLDYHGTMAAYGDAKARLFTELGPGASVIAVDQPFGAELARRVGSLPGHSSTFTVASTLTGGVDADITLASGGPTEDGLSLRFRTPFGETAMQSPLAGAHNIQNLGVALGVLLALDVPLADAAAALSAAPPAPGRLERCHGAQDDVLAFVDYAHTPDALAQALGAVRRMVPGRLFCVFGCGGQRDETKRAPMGAVAARHADVVIVTNDNPRKEDPRRIAEQIVEGLEAAGAHSASRQGIAAGERGYIVELDRPTAVELAAAWAQPRDGVLVAGKGHEAYQIVGDVKSPMDDRALVQSALEARRARMVARPTPR